MDASPATIVACGRAQIQLNIEVSRNNFFYFNLWNLLNRFDGGIRTSMCKAAHPSGGMGSLNP
jgi:hypothetical protein